MDNMSFKSFPRRMVLTAITVVICMTVAMTCFSLLNMTQYAIFGRRSIIGRLIPEEYELKLMPDINAKTFTAKMRITFPPPRYDTELVLNAADTIKITNSGNLIYDYNTTQETITFKILENQREISFSYTGIIYTDLYGLYQTKDASTGTIGLATQFEPQYARRMMPCVDEPLARSVFSLSIVVPSDYLALANTKPREIIKENGNDLYIFEPTPYMPSYLVCICVGKWNSIVGRTKNDVEVSVYTLPSQKEKPNFALKIAIESLEFFEDYTGIKYPLNALQLVAVPDFAAGAMENYGLVTFRDYLLSGKEDDLAMMSRAAEVIAHENAHQWTGNLVSPRSWASTWLNEGFASILPHLALEKTGFFPWSELYSDTGYAALSFDLSNFTHAVEDDFDDPEMMFDDISYEKGASVLNMLRLMLGGETFRKCLSNYLNTFKHSATVTQDLVHSFSQTSGVDLSKFFDSWVYTKGSPVLFVSRTEKGGMEIKQYRAVYDGRCEFVEKPWPFKLFTGENEFVQIENSQQVFDKFSYVNHGRKALVVVKYTDEILSEIAEKWDEIDSNFKWVMIQDLERLIMLNLTSKDKLLDIILKCKKETDPLVFSAATSAASMLVNIYTKDRTLREKLADIVYPWTEFLVKKENLTVFETSTAKKMMHFGGHVCRSDKFKSLSTSSLFKDDFSSLLFKAWTNDGFNELFEMLSTADATTLISVQRALASTPEVPNAQKVFAEFGNKIKWQNVNGVMSTMVSNKYLRDAAFSFFLERSKDLADVFGLGFQADACVQIAFSAARNYEELDLMEQTVRASFKPSMDKTIRRLKQNTAARIRASD